MAAQTGVLRSNRWLDEILIAASEANTDGDGNIYVSMPAGLEHLAIMECMLDVSPLATVAPGIEGFSARWVVTRISDDLVQDTIGVSEIHLRGAAAAASYVSPDPLVEWKETERVQVSYPELDTNAVPTGDASVLIKCVRIRPLEPAPMVPLRLVR